MAAGAAHVMALVESPPPTVTVTSMAGRQLASLTPVPPTVGELRLEVARRLQKQPALLRFVAQEGDTLFDDDAAQLPQEDLDILMIYDETPLFSWELEGNPLARTLDIQGSHLRCPDLDRDFCNVLTKEPIRSGQHYFQFLMHTIGDEGWCGLVCDSKYAGVHYIEHSRHCWAYYCGRMGSTNSGSLHAEGHAVKDFEKVKPTGDVIGMLVDLDSGKVAFELNGRVQGACAIPRRPLWCFTVVDTPHDHVELRKLPLDEADAQSISALNGALLEITGRRLAWNTECSDEDDDAGPDKSDESDEADEADEAGPP